MRRLSAVVAAVTITCALVACDTDPGAPEQPPAPQAAVSLPGDELILLVEEEAGELALSVSQHLFDRSPVVVLAGVDDPAGYESAAASATDLGVPLLLTPATDTGTEALRSELARLEVEAVLAVDEAADRWVRALADPPVVVSPNGTANGATPAPSLPPVAAPEPLPGLAVLTAGGAHTVAATATARAAGADVLVTEATDPRTDPELIDALAAASPRHTIAFGADLGPVDRLRDRLAVATTGVHLPGGGQVLFPGRRLVALYGHPGDSVLGALGEQPVEDAVARAQRVAGEYESLVDEPVVPTMEIITTVAYASPGPQGDYSRRTPVEELRPWVDAAAEAGMYVVLDLQPGHTDFLTQAQEYEELLVEPHVGLALDPEWRLAPDQRHMVQIGSVDAAEVNQVVEWLADLTAQHQLPQKLLIVHQFTLRMITSRDAIDTSRDEIAFMIHADGFGSPGQKFDTWNALRANAPEVWWGWKNFYDEDTPTFTPAETVDIDPSPWFVSYQ